MKLYFSSSCFQTGQIDEVLKLCREHQLNLELGAALDIDPGWRDALAAHSAHLPLLVHNYFPPPAEPFVLNLASADPEVHRRSFDLCFNAIDLCTELGVPFFSVHAGFAFDLPPGHLGRPDLQRQAGPPTASDREQHLEIFMVAVQRLVNYAAARSIDLLVENNVAGADVRDPRGRSPFLLSDIDEIAAFFNEIDHPSLGLLMDTGHAKVSAVGQGIAPQRYPEALAGHIRCWHLSDNNGMSDDHQPISPEAWFAPFLAQQPGVPMVVEAWRLSIEQMQAQQQVVQGILTDHARDLEKRS